MDRSWDPNSQKIVFFTHPIADGSGDFSATRKIIDKLLSMQIQPQNIHLFIIIRDRIFSLYKIYKNMEIELKQNYETSTIDASSINDDFTGSKSVGDQKKIIRDETNITITEEIYQEILKI